MIDFSEEESDTEVVPLEDMFKAYCRMDPISNAMNVELLPLTQSDSWFQAAQVLDMSNVTLTDTGLCFFKFRKRAINYEEFLRYLEVFADTKRLKLDEIKYKLQTCVEPVHPQDEMME